nr:hypothetical transcript [Hymenolepis microstoma]
MKQSVTTLPSANVPVNSIPIARKLVASNPIYASPGLPNPTLTHVECSINSGAFRKKSVNCLRLGRMCIKSVNGVDSNFSSTVTVSGITILVSRKPLS